MIRRSPALRALLALAILDVAAIVAACAPRAVTPSPASATMMAPRQPRITPDAPGEARFVDSVLALMTLEEKAGQLNQLSGLADPTGPGGTEAGAGQIRRGEVGSLLNVIGADTTRSLQRIAVEQSRMHIPLVFALDVIHGYRTTFPVPLGEAASWNPSGAEGTA